MERPRSKLPCWVAVCALVFMLAGSSHAGGFPDLGDLDDLDGESRTRHVFASIPPPNSKSSPG